MDPLTPNVTTGPKDATTPRHPPGTRPQILVISDVHPWPARDGYRLRLGSILESLARIGDVDLFVAAFDDENLAPDVPDNIGRCEIVVVRSTRRSMALAARTIRSELPRRILWRDWDLAKEGLLNFVEGPYALVWYSHADTFVALGEPSFGTAIVDLDNLEDRVLRPARRQPGQWRHVSRVGTRLLNGEGRPRLRALARSILDRRDVRKWSRLQRDIAERAALVVVCSDIDRSRLTAERVVVIPNGYRDPGPPNGSVPSAQTLVMIARFTYDPNTAGATWFVRHVLPELRKSRPEAVVRFIGRHDGRLDEIRGIPGVEIVGEVDDIGPVFSDARCVIVPLLTGSGTRIKVLEALAYGAPVVTTTVGCEGIPIDAGRHALVADDPLAFASACSDVLADNSLCERLRSEGRRLFLQKYSNNSIGEQITALAAQVIRSPAPSRSPEAGVTESRSSGPA